MKDWKSNWLCYFLRRSVCKKTINFRIKLVKQALPRQELSVSQYFNTLFSPFNINIFHVEPYYLSNLCLRLSLNSFQCQNIYCFITLQAVVHYSGRYSSLFCHHQRGLWIYTGCHPLSFWQQMVLKSKRKHHMIL